MCGANHFPGSSTTSEVVSNDSSPGKHFQLGCVGFVRIEFHEQPIRAAIGENLQPIMERRIGFIGCPLLDDVLEQALPVGVHVRPCRAETLILVPPACPCGTTRIAFSMRGTLPVSRMDAMMSGPANQIGSLLVR